MEYVVLVLALAVFVLAVFVLESVRARKEEKKFVKYLYEDFGKIIEKQYPVERYERIGSFFNRHPKDGQLDDITWNDLGMDEIFKRMNYTFSASGEEYLYYTLRTLKQDDRELAHLEEVINFIGENPDIRVKIQLAMNRLGHTGKYSLYDYLDNLDFLGERSNRKNILMDLLFLPLIGLLWVNFSVGVIGIVILVIYNIVSYFKEKAEIDPYIISFSYIMRLLHECGELEKISVPVCAGEWETIKKARRQLSAMTRNSYWVMSPFRGQSNASGNVLAILLDYIRMVFHADLIKFNGMLRVLRGHIQDVDDLIQTAGYMETAIAIWEFRKSLETEVSKGWCVPCFCESGGKYVSDSREGLSKDGHDSDFWEESAGNGRVPGSCENLSGDGRDSNFREESVGDKHVSNSGDGFSGDSNAFGSKEDSDKFVQRLEIQEGYHPLLKEPVKNSISAQNGILLTGSNASGKSTFLKTIAINAILAQTIHTCAADNYKASFFYVYSSMALKDDISSGESYYIVEIKALKRILDAAAEKRKVLCFVDEVLRGTNTVERIAASTQILKSLCGRNILCFAATHDVELTELLQGYFDNYHFEEDVRDGDVFFNYRLKSGKATTRNAIKLLELMGYDKEIIEKASAQAEQFIASGKWN